MLLYSAFVRYRSSVLPPSLDKNAVVSAQPALDRRTSSSPVMMTILDDLLPKTMLLKTPDRLLSRIGLPPHIMVGQASRPSAN